MSLRFDDIDLAITEDGDLVWTSDEDLGTVSELDYVIQTVRNRLMSIASDWYYDNIGADIESFIGKPNNKETCDEIVRSITDSLISDGFCDFEDTLVTAQPLSTSDAIVGVFINTGFSETPIGFVVEMNFLTGFMVKRIQ